MPTPLGYQILAGSQGPQGASGAQGAQGAQGAATTKFPYLSAYDSAGTSCVGASASTQIGLGTTNFSNDLTISTGTITVHTAGIYQIEACIALPPITSGVMQAIINKNGANAKKGALIPNNAADEFSTVACRLSLAVNDTITLICFNSGSTVTSRNTDTATYLDMSMISIV